MKRFCFTVITAVVSLDTATAEAQNCCIPNLGDDSHSARLIDGIQSATLLLIAVPYLLVAGISLGLYRRWRN